MHPQTKSWLRLSIRVDWDGLGMWNTKTMLLVSSGLWWSVLFVGHVPEIKIDWLIDWLTDGRSNYQTDWIPKKDLLGWCTANKIMKKFLTRPVAEMSNFDKWKPHSLNNGNYFHKKIFITLFVRMYVSPGTQNKYETAAKLYLQS